MSEEFKVEIVNPEKSYLSNDNAIEVIVPGYEGEMGILKEHISIISFLKPGVIISTMKLLDIIYCLWIIFLLFLLLLQYHQPYKKQLQVGGHIHLCILHQNL